MKQFDLQLFADGGEGGSKQGENAGNGNGGQNAGTGYSFQQAEEIANARAQRAEKSALASYFKQQGLSEEQITQAISDYKAQQAAQKPNIDAITRERDEARAELASMKNGQILTGKGVRSEDIDYVTFKVEAMAREDDKLDFEKAATKFLKDNPRYTSSGASYKIKTGADGNDTGSATGTNAHINDAIRRAAQR